MIRSTILAKYPELIHGFSTAEDGPMAAIKLTPEKLVNRLSFWEQLGVDPDRVAIPHQAHETEVKIIKEADLSGVNDGRSAFESADALITDKLDTYLSVFTADCIPLFIYDPTSHKVATVHLGWRGLTQQLLEKVIKQFDGPKNLAVWVGPHIHSCHYKLSPDVDTYKAKIAAFADWPQAVTEQNGESFLDLTGVIMGQLTDMGVASSQVEVAEDCTACYSDKYFSYHMTNGQQPGQMMGVIGMRHDES